MLILNNGVPKSGSTWIQQIIVKMLDPKFPPAEWRNKWKNPSVEPERLEDYFNDGSWKGAPVLLKMHIINGPEFEFLKSDDVRVIVSYRNVPDSVLSWFYMAVRLGTAKIEDKNTWLETEGVKFAERLIAHRNSWLGHPNALFLKYENVLEKPSERVVQLAQFLNHDVDEKRIPDIIEATQVKLAEGEKPRDDSHFRTGGRSLAKDEMTPATFNKISEMEQNTALIV